MRRKKSLANTSQDIHAVNAPIIPIALLGEQGRQQFFDEGFIISDDEIAASMTGEIIPDSMQLPADLVEKVWNGQLKSKDVPNVTQNS